ncbi:MAG TPA: CinA family nicotinamide mononucleotide deamidase-related protein, partial [Candidatus Polarisedimenticolaceae bacterium]|nr:CinA family nicotinamide mononucleotide deamidase-related protein [Candidatus Polarisedimenticolaceae bacterium]
DDRTREAIARAIGVPLERDEDQVGRLRRLFDSRKRPFSAEQCKQADKPAGADWIENELGSAPGIRCPVGRATVVALPGVPAEMQRMFDQSVVPWLADRVSGRPARRTLKVGGRLESSVDRQLRDLYGVDGVDVTILAGSEGIELQLAARADSADEARRAIERLERRIRDRLGDDLYGVDDETPAEIVGRMLRERGLTVATAESCTAGLLAAAITEVPGSSAWFRGGIVVYHDDTKERFLSIPRAMIDRHGAVSEEVGRALAAGVRREFAADVGLGVTGIAGPGGGSPDKPVGLVQVALADADGIDSHETHQVGDRRLIRRRTVLYVLDLLRRRLLARPGRP